jgi:triosephosphate isomerase|tara:strand:+ start:506 stop:1228 length:723 start_codon:yes stop_codon:yes gene_type:complete
MKVIANWKMNLPTPDIRSWTENFYSNVNLDDSKTIGVAPPFTHISNCVTYLQNLRVGAQNISSRDLGNNTGEISASIAKDSGASFVILGHSEVRENLDEQSSLINKKIAIAIEKNLSPVVCFGESRESYENGITKDFVCSQLKECFEGIKAETIIIAYEPIWSIGTGITPETNEINEIHNTIKDYCKNHLKFVPESVLYGGSVTDKNCKNLITGENIDGFLVGGASLDGNSFARIVNNCF